MCNHYRSDPTMLSKLSTWREFIGQPSLAVIPEAATDVWPKRPAVVVREVDSERIVDMMTWGVPLTVPGKRPGTTLTRNVTNVRNLSSPFWRSMMMTPAQRCLVLFTTFAEPKIGCGREEHWFTIADRPLAAFAGIWRPSPIGNVFAFLTCEPNPLVAPLHPKAMPVVLHEADYGAWLSANHAEACALVAPFPSQLMAVECLARLRDVEQASKGWHSIGKAVYIL